MTKANQIAELMIEICEESSKCFCCELEYVCNKIINQPIEILEPIELKQILQSGHIE